MSKTGDAHSPLISLLQESEEELLGFSLRSESRFIKQCIPLIPPPSMPSPTSPTSQLSSPTPPPPTLRVGMASAFKLPLFRGVRNEEPDQFQFVVKVVWEAQGIMDDNIKKATLVSALQDHALTWYIKYSSDHPNVGTEAIQDALNKEFRRMKSEMQLIIGFKEIVMIPGETPWDIDQRLRSTIHQANMTLTDAQHRVWFVVSLTPHLRTALSQQKISTQAESLEIEMRLCETPIQDLGLGVQQIHTQLQNQCLEMETLKQDRVP